MFPQPRDLTQHLAYWCLPRAASGGRARQRPGDVRLLPPDTCRRWAGITVSLGAALKELPGSGLAAAGFFLVALLLNLGSYVFVQLDMRARMDTLRRNPTACEGAENSGWTRWTWLMNVAAGIGLLAGGVLLVIFIGRNA